MLSTVTDGQTIDKDAVVRPQAKTVLPKPQEKNVSVNPQTTANARSPSAGGDLSSKKTIQTGDTRAVSIEATSGSFRLDTKRSYHVKTPYGALNVPN
jgi:hypothetical protein